jgi:hypothetical protein
MSLDLSSHKEPEDEMSATWKPPILNIKAIDDAFERMFGYTWGSSLLGTTTDAATDAVQLPNDLIQIFRSKHKVAQILKVRLPTTKSTTMTMTTNAIPSVHLDNNEASPPLPPKNPTATNAYADGVVVVDAARFLTRRIDSNGIANHSNKRKRKWILSSNVDATTTSNDEYMGTYQRRKLEESDYKNIELPNQMNNLSSVTPNVTISGTASTTTITATDTAQLNNAENAPSISSNNTTTTTTTITSTNMTNTKDTSNSTTTGTNLDSVLQQLVGTKKMNTVEKTNQDWESFKQNTDPTFQDELEKTAQSKDAYLIKQDFLQRVDQRRFELERSERDQERVRRAATSNGK